MPIEWEEVTVTPILLPDGKTTIPPVAINSMNKNKIGLKGNVQTFVLIVLIISCYYFLVGILILILCDKKVCFNRVNIRLCNTLSELML